MEEEQRRATKRRMISLMQAGYTWQEAVTIAGVQMGRSAASPEARASGSAPASICIYVSSGHL